MNSTLDIQFTKKGFEEFCVALNHRLSKIESDVTWMKRIMWYLAGIVSVAVGKIIFLGG
ncbi:MAG: hypothetical protein ACFFDS_08005 [Candidatus Thorarchaeota archaeon]